MNKLQQLIQELCPNGVEWKTLGEIGIFIRGNGLQKKDFTESGIGCIHYGQIYTYYGTFTDKVKSFVSVELAKKLKKINKGDLVIANTGENIEDICKAVAWLGNDEIVTGGHSTIFKHNQNPKYIAYYFQTEMFAIQKRKYAKGAKVVEVSAKDLEKITIPIPPIPIQTEIAHILDKFSTLTAELQAELQARKSQYEYYRNQLLDYPMEESDQPSLRSSQSATSIKKNDNLSQQISKLNPHTDNSVLQPRGKVEWKKLGETCYMKSGKNISSTSIFDTKTNDYPFQCFGGNGMRGYVSKCSHTGNYPIIGRQGALCGNINYASGNFYATEHAVVVKSKGLYLQRYLFYLLQNMNLNQYKSQGAQPGLAVGNIEEILAPVPPLSEQERIVSILDKFDTLTNSITEGLPKEIELRQKQYEYYRDMLLTFPRVNA